MLEKFNKIERALNYALENIDNNQGEIGANYDKFIYTEALKNLRELKQEIIKRVEKTAEALQNIYNADGLRDYEHDLLEECKKDLSILK